MNIYLVTQEFQGYDIYDAVVVQTKDIQEAYDLVKDKIYHQSKTIELIGKNKDKTSKIILESFNAG